MAAPHNPSLTVGRIAEICGGRLVAGERLAGRVVRRVAAIDAAGEDALTWCAEQRLAAKIAESRAVAIIGSEDVVGADERGIVVEDPELAIAQVLDAFFSPPQPPALGAHPTAVIHPTARLGTETAIGAYAVIGEGVVLGDGAVIHEGVSLGKEVLIGEATIIYDRCVIYDRCRIGKGVIIHAGAVIGADSFGYIFRDGRHRKLSHLGTVVIEDEVEIGANTCIDRAKLGATRIGRGTKIDDLVMIAHNVQFGPMCIVTAQCGIAGSTKVGAGVTMGGQSGISHGITMGDGARIAAKATLFKDVPAGGAVSGMPAQDHRTELRDRARVRKLPQLLERVAALEKRVAELENSADH